ncbi:hypothetical protein BJX99DRAFT_223686 [Aspergillus californicus]
MIWWGFSRGLHNLLGAYAEVRWRRYIFSHVMLFVYLTLSCLLRLRIEDLVIYPFEQ